MTIDLNDLARCMAEDNDLARRRDGSMDDNLRRTGQLAGQHMTDILALFKPGARVALAVWWPGAPGQDFTLVHPDATIQDAIDTFQRRLVDPDSITGRTGG